MKTQKKLYTFNCCCDQRKPLEKTMEVKALPRRKQKAEPVWVDVFCHWCSKDCKVKLDDDFAPDNPLRE